MVAWGKWEFGKGQIRDKQKSFIGDIDLAVCVNRAFYVHGKTAIYVVYTKLLLDACYFNFF